MGALQRFRSWANGGFARRALVTIGIALPLGVAAGWGAGRLLALLAPKLFGRMDPWTGTVGATAGLLAVWLWSEVRRGRPRD